MAKDRQGFTLIELLIVIVIIGILAAIAVPKFASTKERAYIGTLKSDLRILVTAQEGYYFDHSTYYIGSVPNTGFIYNPSRDVNISIQEATGGGWSATATHGRVPGQTCAVFYGNAAPVAPAVTEGTVACE